MKTIVIWKNMMRIQNKLIEYKIKINDLENPGILDNIDSLNYNFTDNDLFSNMISMKCAYILFNEE